MDNYRFSHTPVHRRRNRSLSRSRQEKLRLDSLNEKSMKKNYSNDILITPGPQNNSNFPNRSKKRIRSKMRMMLNYTNKTYSRFPSEKSKGKNDLISNNLTRLRLMHLKNRLINELRNRIRISIEGNNLHFQINTLTIKDFDENDEGLNNITKTALLRANLLHITDHLDSLKISESFMAAAVASKDVSQSVKDRHTQIKGKISDYTKLSEDLNSKIKSIEHNKLANNCKLKLPNFGNNENIDIEQLKLSNSIFDNTNVPLEEWWMKLSNFGQSHKFSEQAFKLAISYLTSNVVFETYYALKDKPLEKILEAFVDRFGPISSINDYLNKLESFERDPGENIASCMVRLEILIDKTQTCVPENQREMRKNILKNQYLLALAHPKAKQKVKNAKHKAYLAGHNLTFDQIFDIVKNAEKYDTNISISAIDAPKQNDNKSIPAFDYNSTNNTRFADKSPLNQRKMRSKRNISKDFHPYKRKVNQFTEYDSFPKASNMPKSNDQYSYSNPNELKTQHNNPQMVWKNPKFMNNFKNYDKKVSFNSDAKSFHRNYNQLSDFQQLNRNQDHNFVKQNLYNNDQFQYHRNFNNDKNNYQNYQNYQNRFNGDRYKYLNNFRKNNDMLKQIAVSSNPKFIQQSIEPLCTLPDCKFTKAHSISQCFSRYPTKGIGGKTGQ